MQGSVRITGRELDPPQLLRVARHRAQVELAAEAVARMQATHDVVGALAARGEPVYGMTTGLGSYCPMTRRSSPPATSTFPRSPWPWIRWPSPWPRWRRRRPSGPPACAPSG